MTRLLIVALSLLLIPVAWADAATIIEDFESYPLGPIASPTQFRGFRWTGDGLFNLEPSEGRIVSECVDGSRCLSTPNDGVNAGGAGFLFGKNVVGFKIDVDIVPSSQVYAYWETYSASDPSIIFGYSQEFISPGTVELPRNPFGFLSDERISSLVIHPSSIFPSLPLPPSVIRSFDDAVTTVVPLPAPLLLLPSAVVALGWFGSGGQRSRKQA